MRPILRQLPSIALLSGLLAACGGESDPPTDPDDGGDDAADGSPDDGGDDSQGDGSEAPDPVEGSYRLTTTFDVSASPLLPGLVGGALSGLTDLADDPAGALFAALDLADVPVLDQLLAVLPDAVVDQVAGFINDFLLERLFEGVPATEALAQLVADLSALLTHFDVVSQLDLGPLGEAGATRAGHAIAGVQFGWRGEPVLVDTPAVLDQLTAATDIDGAVTLAGGDGILTLGDHAFHLPLGDFAVIGIDLALSTTLGVADLRELLGAVFDCPGLADAVSSRCLGPVCVGHRDELLAVCDAGLDLVAAQLEERIASIDYTEIRFESGSAVVRDAPDPGAAADGVIDAIEGGNWQSSVLVDGVGQAPLPSPFTGRRVPPGE